MVENEKGNAKQKIPVMPTTGKPLITSPWASAVETRENIVETIEYPVLDGMGVMLIIPNDYYRKKLMPLGPGYVATAMQRCGIDVSIMDCTAY